MTPNRVLPADLEGAAELAVADALFTLAQGEPAADRLSAAAAGWSGASRADGQRMQLAVLRRWLDRGERLGGWKIAFTSRGLRGAMGEEYRPFGYVLAGRIQAGGGTLADHVPGCALEPELCLTIGERLGGTDVTPERARSAVRSVSGAFEINSKRLPAGSSEAVRIGNAMNNWGIVLGPEHAPDVALDAVSVTVFEDGRPVATGDSGPATLDDPYLSLARVCRVLAEHGLSLEPGQRVITGSLTPGIPAGGASEYHAEFSGLGTVAVSLR